MTSRSCMLRYAALSALVLRRSPGRRVLIFPKVIAVLLLFNATRNLSGLPSTRASTEVWPHVWPIQIHAQRKPALMDSRPIHPVLIMLYKPSTLKLIMKLWITGVKFM